MTQIEDVADRLREGWTCGTTLLAAMIPRFGARIFELRRRGVVVERRRCVNPEHHHRSVQWEWRIAP